MLFFPAEASRVVVEGGKETLLTRKSSAETILFDDFVPSKSGFGVVMEGNEASKYPLWKNGDDTHSPLYHTISDSISYYIPIKWLISLIPILWW